MTAEPVRSVSRHLPLRSPGQVMRLSRLGSAFPTRLSFVRTLLRRLQKECVRVERKNWTMDEGGYGHAVYSLNLGGRTYSLIAFSTPISDAQRSDRVVAQVWDTSFCLFDGLPDADDIARLAAQVPLQEAGRFRQSELILCRANRSVRFFDYVVARLASGQQPDRRRLIKTGYLLRTTAVYGNGKFGIADRSAVGKNVLFVSPFFAEMLTVWLVRGFSHDLVEHIARQVAPATAVKLDEAGRMALGVGNSTGLGMAPFLIRHPLLLDSWILARERALALFRQQMYFSETHMARLMMLMPHVATHLQQWQVDDELMQRRISLLTEEWQEALTDLFTGDLAKQLKPVDYLLDKSRTNGEDFQELLVASLIEVAGDEYDWLADEMSAGNLGWIQAGESTVSLNRTIREHYGWALTIDFSSIQESYYFWYVSEEKLEPRLGIRAQEAGAEREMPLDIARQIQSLFRDLEIYARESDVAQFLRHYPVHRQIIKRVQAIKAHSYMEIQDNLLKISCFPIDLLRLKLSFFGASKFDPRSDRWIRITLFQGAPCADGLARHESHHAWLPVIA